MANLSFPDKTYGTLDFNNIGVSETDTGPAGSFSAFTNNPWMSFLATDVAGTGYQGLLWQGFSADALQPGSSVALEFNYDVHESDTTLGVNGLQLAFTPHLETGSGISLTGVMYAYADAARTQLVGQMSIDLSQPASIAPYAVSDFQLSAAFSDLYISVDVVASVAAGAPAGSSVGFSIIDQGFHQTALANQAGLGDTVWDDANKDGIQDNGETGVSGVTVTLLDANGNSTGLTATTDANGYYSFTNLNVGAYQVQFTPPPDYTFTETGQGTAATDSNADQITGKTGLVTLTAGEFDSTIDAGLVSSGSHETTTAALGDYVWNDSNANGVQDAGETGISGVTVQLLDSGNTVIGTTTTDANGYYAFTSLAAGTYEVAFTAPTAYQFSVSGQGTPATDSNPDKFTGNVGTTEQVTLADGQVDNTIDAGLYQLASLGDYVWADTNSNGIQDSGETGVSGVTVNLLNSAGNVVYGTTTTDATGYYGFTSLTPGVYEVQFVAPALASFSPTGQGTTATDSNPNTTTGVTGPITLVSGQTDLTIDAGLILPPPVTPPTAQLGDRVWYDCNNNGIQNAGETGVANVTVNLLDSTGTTVLATTTTNSSGNYLFTSLAAGVYEVQFVAPSGRAFTAALQGSNRATDSNPDGTGITGPITLAAGQSDLTIDAGLVRAPCTASLGDLVFRDCNGNGIQDSGDRGVGGVTVKLLNSGGNVISTTTTDSNGKYLFTNLAAGTYSVQFVAPSAMSFTTQTAGSNRAIDSNPDASGQTGPITLVAGQSDRTIDAGLVRAPCTAKLGDLVFCDANKNGIQDSGEGGIGGVTVKLLNSGGSSVLATTTTNSAGNYQFSGLAAGTYTVQFVTPGSYTLSPALQGSNTAKDSNPSVSTGKTGVITLAAGQTDLTIDAGMYKTSTGGGGCGTGGGGNNGGGGGGCDTGGVNGGGGHNGGGNGGWCDTGTGGNGGGSGGNGGWCDTGNGGNGGGSGGSGGNGGWCDTGNGGSGGGSGGNGGWCDTGNRGNGGGSGGGSGGNGGWCDTGNGGNNGGWGGNSGGWGGRECDTVNQRDFSCGVNGGGNGGYGGQSPCFVQGGGGNSGGNSGGSWGGGYGNGGYNDCDTSRDLTYCNTGNGGSGGSNGGWQGGSNDCDNWGNYGGSQNAWGSQQGGNQWSGGYSGSDSHYGSGGYCGYN